MTTTAAAEQLTIITPGTERDLDGVMALFAQTWTTKDRSRESVSDMLFGPSVCLAVANSDGDLVAFARAITDDVFAAVIVDIIVDAGHRRVGIGRELVTAIRNHPALAGLESIELSCSPALAPWFADIGFRAPNQLVTMRRTE